MKYKTEQATQHQHRQQQKTNHRQQQSRQKQMSCGRPQWKVSVPGKKNMLKSHRRNHLS